MSIEHINRIRAALENNKWSLLEEKEGDDYSISAIWDIARPNSDYSMSIVFEGLDDKEVLPIEKSYGCHIKNNKEISLYFGSLKQFPKNLSGFINALSDKQT